MFHRLREPFGKAGLIVAIVALVAALAGGAYAANNHGGKHHKKGKNNAGLNGKQKKQVKSISKSEAKKFANSNPGAPGAQGPAGANGTDGTNGTPGAPGKNVALTTEPEGVNCEEGGTKVEVEGNAASAKYVCNGEAGAEGSPWTAGGTLPPEQSETGTWSFQSLEAAHALGYNYQVPITIPIPLPGVIAGANTHIEAVGYTGSDPNCPGTAAEPKAKAGHFCLYTAREEGTNEAYVTSILQSGSATLEQGVSPAGAVIGIVGEENMVLTGTWAVTAAP